MGMSFIGSYSGIDQATIDQLMEAERIPLNHMTRRKENIVEKQNAWKDINTRLNSLFQKMEALKKADTFETKIARSSDDKYVSMTASTKAAEGKYNIKVENLATNSSMVGTRVKDGEKLVDPEKALDIKKGIFTITSGIVKDGEDIVDEGISRVIELEGGESLKEVVDKINLATKDVGEEKGTGITATIVDGRIVLNDEKTGARGISLRNEDPANNILGEIGLDENSTEFKEDVSADVKSGLDAIFTLNNIVITRSSNTISDAIDGVTINLNQAHTGEESDTITVSTDTEKAAKLVQDFVNQYNSTMQFISEKTNAGDPEKPGSKGILAGESSLQRLETSLRRSVTGIFGERDTINVSTKIGISTTDKTGKLSFDKDRFLESLEEDKEGVMNFLNPKEGEGLVGRVNKEIDLFISKKDGIIKSQNESFERTQKDLSKQIENFEARMVKKEAYYVKTFTALDIAMMKAEDQMGWLVGQIDSMNAGRR